MIREAHYTVRLDAPHRHEVAVEMRLSGDLPDPLVVAMAVWNPGSYMVREFSRNVIQMSARSGTKDLPVVKTRKDRWEIRTGGAPEVVVEYRLYCHELSVRTNHVDDSHAHLEGPATFLYVPGALSIPVRVRIEAPPGWKVFTGLDPDEDGRRVASDLHELFDAPIEILGPAAPPPLEFEAVGRRHEIAFWGQARLDPDRLVADVRAIIVEACALFGGPPYERYVFLAHLVPGGRGGLEHRNSTTLQISPHAFGHPEAYDEVRSLFAHEYFHLWNAKRIRPEGLSPYEYGAENYTRLLYVSEGFTAYYDWLLLRRAGLVSPERYLKHLATEIARLEEVPGRHLLPLEEASFDAWIRQYRPDENTINTAVSYYTKGELVGATLDLELRARSAELGATRTLDDFFRMLWSRRDRPIPEAGVADLVREATGVDVQDLFERYVRGRVPIDYGAHLARAGLALRQRQKPDAPAAHVGIRTRNEGGRLMVLSVLRDSPAERAGLYAGDELIALDGFRVDEGSLRERVKTRRPGERLRLSIFRRERLGDLELDLGEAPPEDFSIVACESPSEDQKAIYSAWMHASWPPASE